MSRLKTLATRLQPQANRIATAVPGSWRSDKATSTQRGYGYAWQQARLVHLNAHPLCVYCERDDRVTAASVVDHVIPHRGDMTLFWDRTNWQSLCKHCHDSHKQRFEKSGRVFGCTEDGQPIDPAHGWNQP